MTTSRYDPDGGKTVGERFHRLGHGVMDFQSVWESLAEQGVVLAVITVNGDPEADPGWSAYLRVIQEWQKAGCPEAIGNFIRALG